LFKNENLGNDISSGEELRQMVIFGDAMMIDYGTNCYVLERAFGRAKVRITSGRLTGAIGWVYEERLREGQHRDDNIEQKSVQVEQINKDPLHVAGIVYDAKDPLVIIGSDIYHRGDSIKSFKIKEIFNDYVEFVDSKGEVFQRHMGE
jgi:hypothetical protein